MRKVVPLKLQDPKYYRHILCAVLEHLRDDDFFYQKRANWEEWIVMRADIENVLSTRAIESTELPSDMVDGILSVLNGGVWNV